MQTLHQVFTAVLTNQDMKKHIPYPVQVPPGTRLLRIRLSYAPHTVERIKNLLTLTILDPAGFRGRGSPPWQSCWRWSSRIMPPRPAFSPAPFQPGEWTVLVDTHMIMPARPSPLSWQ